MTSYATLDILIVRHAAYYIARLSYFLIPCVLIPSIRVLMRFKYRKEIRTCFTFVVFKQYKWHPFVEFSKAYTCHADWPLLLANFKVSFGTRILRGILQWTHSRQRDLSLALNLFWYTEYIVCCSVDLLMHIDEVHLMKYMSDFLHIEIASCWFVRGFFYYIGMKDLYPNIHYCTLLDHGIHHRRIPRQINLYASKCYKEKRSETSIWDMKPYKWCKIMFFWTYCAYNDNQDPIHRSVPKHV